MNGLGIFDKILMCIVIKKSYLTSMAKTFLLRTVKFLLRDP